MDDLIAKYQRSRRAVEDAKKNLQEACDAARDATIPLAQAWLNENYPDASAKVEPAREDLELSIKYAVLFTTEDLKREMETQKRIFNELEQYLKSVREEV
jgi:hypothetical protein